MNLPVIVFSPCICAVSVTCFWPTDYNRIDATWPCRSYVPHSFHLCFSEHSTLGCSCLEASHMKKCDYLDQSATRNPSHIKMPCICVLVKTSVSSQWKARINCQTCEWISHITQSSRDFQWLQPLLSSDCNHMRDFKGVLPSRALLIHRTVRKNSKIVFLSQFAVQ